MACEHEQNSEYLRSRRPASTLDSHAGYDAGTQHSQVGMLTRLPDPIQNTGIGARCNAPVRAEGLRQMQQSHGNRAVQRALSTSGPAGPAPVQREAWEEFDPDEALRNVEAYTSYEPSTSQVDAAKSGQPLGPAALPTQAFGSAADLWNHMYLQSHPGASPANGLGKTQMGADIGTIQASGEQSFWDRFTNPGEINSMVDFGVSTTKVMAEAARRGIHSSLLPELTKSPVGNFVSRLPGAETLATLSDNFSFPGAGSKALSKISTGGNILGIGMGINNFINATDNYERVQAGADTTASAIGLLGLPGAAFSGGYSAGQLLNKGADWLGDWITGNEEEDHSLSGLLSDAMVSVLDGPSLDELSGDQLSTLADFPIVKEKVRQEQSERRAFSVRSQNRNIARKDAEGKARFEKEIAGYEAIARGEVRPYDLGTLGGPVVRPNIPEEEGMPAVSMSLPRGLR